ncbi:F-box protein SKIP23-like [Pistacia vera]|uniref:F-box protein SKIP23-like n=1 Tax=Pistacia vera TaxID=55513 RepID=UPI001263DF09|nr:F-box protein SKIP23-like [Pistacia vera]XP_031287365.1 F-box protein SKIP23-like [Pistacia vera]
MDLTLPDYSELPNHLLSVIAEYLDDRFDTHHFRAVCNSFFDSAERPRIPISPHKKIKVYYPLCVALDRWEEFVLAESTIYALEPINKISNTHLTTKTWLVRVEEIEPGKVILEDPLSRIYVNQVTRKLPKTLNLLEYRAKEIAKSFRLELVSPSIARHILYFEKVVVSPLGGFCVMALVSGGRVGIWRFSTRNWLNIAVVENGFRFEDISYHDNKFYAMGTRGVTMTVDPETLDIFEVAGPLQRWSSGFKYLVDSSDGMYLVDKFWVEECCACHMDIDEEDCPIRLIVFKLDEQRREWLPLRNELRDRALFVGEDCTFSVSTKDFAGVKPNCVYFADDEFYRVNRHHPGVNTGLFDLETQIAAPLGAFPGYSKLFWPPPTWLK